MAGERANQSGFLRTRAQPHEYERKAETTKSSSIPFNMTWVGRGMNRFTLATCPPLLKTSLYWPVPFCDPFCVWMGGGSRCLSKPLFSNPHGYGPKGRGGCEASCSASIRDGEPQMPHSPCSWEVEVTAMTEPSRKSCVPPLIERGVVL